PARRRRTGRGDVAGAGPVHRRECASAGLLRPALPRRWSGMDAAQCGRRLAAQPLPASAVWRSGPGPAACAVPRGRRLRSGYRPRRGSSAGLACAPGRDSAAGGGRARVHQCPALRGAWLGDNHARPSGRDLASGVAVLARGADAMSGALAIFVKTPGWSALKTRLAAGTGDAYAERWYRLAADAVASVAIRARAQHGLTAYW